MVSRARLDGSVSASIRSLVIASLLAVLLLPAIAAAQLRSYAFIANAGGDSVSVIDSTTNTVVQTITGITTPRSVAVTPDGQRALVVSQNGLLYIIDVATLSLSATTIPLGTAAYTETIAITPDGTKAYVTG